VHAADLWVTRVHSAGVAVIAVDCRMLASTQRVAAIQSASISISAVEGFGEAAQRGVACVHCARIVVLAVDVHVRAAAGRPARVVGACVEVIARESGNNAAVCGVAGSGVAHVGGVAGDGGSDASAVEHVAFRRCALVLWTGAARLAVALAHSAPVLVGTKQAK